MCISLEKNTWKMCISLEKNTWKIIFGQGKVRENCRGPSAATLFKIYVKKIEKQSEPFTLRK